MSIAENIQNIKYQIEEAVKKSNRKIEDIKLIAVSKTFSEKHILEALNCGITDFGENYVQEFVEKFNNLKSYNINWHFIGHLQTNKIKFIFDKIYLLQTLDSLKLAEKINKKLGSSDRKLDALIQINIGEETAKYGIKINELEQFIEKMVKFKNLQIKGLMCIPPFFEDPEKVRPYFVKMRELFDKFKNFNEENIELKELSMGMSNDFRVAIEEGATIIRIGTAIFGSRACKFN